MKVYVIEKGRYSDRHVVGVVESKEEAEEICKAVSGHYYGEDATYEEYDTTRFQNNHMRFIVYNSSFYERDDWRAEYDDYDLHKEFKENTEYYDGVYIIYANSPDVAIKIAQDMKAEKLAKEKGVSL